MKRKSQIDEEIAGGKKEWWKGGGQWDCLRVSRPSPLPPPAPSVRHYQSIAYHFIPFLHCRYLNSALFLSFLSLSVSCFLPFSLSLSLSLCLSFFHRLSPFLALSVSFLTMFFSVCHFSPPPLASFSIIDFTVLYCFLHTVWKCRAVFCTIFKVIGN